MKRKILGGLAAAAMLAGGLALTTAGSASATQDQPPRDDKCYAEEIVPTYGDVIEKETRTRYWVEGTQGVPSKWWVWSPNNSQGPQDYTPNFPTDERGTWQGPKTDGGPSQDQIGTFNQSNGNSGNLSWFHREAGVDGTDGYWGEWDEWIDWPDADPVNDDGRDRGPLPHGEGEGWQRQYRYVVVGQFQTGTKVVKTEVPCQVPDPAKLRLTFIQECGIFTPPSGPWSPPETVQFRLRNGNSAPVDYVLRQAGGGIIEQRELPVGDSFVTFPFGARTLILETYNAAGEKVHSDTKAGGDTYLTTNDDGEKCRPSAPEDEVTEGDWIGEPECGQKSFDQTRTVTTISYAWDGEEFVAEEPVETSEKRTVPVEVFEPCPTTPPNPENPPTPTPAAPTPTETPTQVAAQGPVPPPAAAPAPPSATASATPSPTLTELPSTGSSSWGLALTALASLLGGLGLVKLSRRTS